MKTTKKQIEIAIDSPFKVKSYEENVIEAPFNSVRWGQAIEYAAAITTILTELGATNFSETAYELLGGSEIRFGYRVKYDYPDVAPNDDTVVTAFLHCSMHEHNENMDWITEVDSATQDHVQKSAQKFLEKHGGQKIQSPCAIKLKGQMLQLSGRFPRPHRELTISTKEIEAVVDGLLISSHTVFLMGRDRTKFQVYFDHDEFFEMLHSQLGDFLLRKYILEVRSENGKEEKFLRKIDEISEASTLEGGYLL